MARHSNGQENYKPAGWVIAVAIVVIVAIIALLYFWLGNDNGDDVNNAADQESTAQETSSDEATSDDASAETSVDEASTEENSDEETPSEEPETSEAPAPAPSADTLILLDTSNAMAGQFDPVSGALANTARALSGANKAVALWNYSSPLNPGVTVGYRDNLGFGNGDEAANTIQAFGTGGEPQTRPAVIAAADVAADRAADINGPVRVLLVTTGTVTAMDDAAFADAFAQAAGNNVELSVVHVGPGAPDAAVEDVATEFTSVDGTDSRAVADALKAAAGA
ncbi:hypothetical protein [Corynebacterium stationis]|uniref:hypothetical protein n=1 Tax=Corynebacterium stationis TaxID=1705 RepID=UPI00263B7C9A|nr:hypothetical protein [Corynebacterium stationis]